MLALPYAICLLTAGWREAKLMGLGAAIRSILGDVLCETAAKSQCLSRVLNDLRSCPTIECGAVFVRSAVLLAGVYWLSAEIWVLRYVCSKWSETFGVRALRCSLRRGFIDEDVERG